MEKNTILAIVLSSIVLIGSMFIQTTFFSPTEEAVTSTNQTEQDTSIVQSADALVTDASALNTNASTVDVLGIDAIDDDVELKEEEFVIKTNLLEVTFTNRGGDIVSYKLLNYKDQNDVVQMADNVSSANRAFSIELGPYADKVVDEIFSVRRINDYSIGFYKKLAIKNTDGTTGVFTLVKQYTFEPNDYVFKLDVTIDGEENFYGLNLNNAGYTIGTFPQIGPYYDQKNNKYETRTFMAYNGEKKKKNMVPFGKTQEYTKPFTWQGVAGKYFTVLIAPSNSAFNKATYSSLYKAHDDYSDAQILLTREPVSSSKAQDTFYVYAGPRTEEFLKKYNNAQDNAWGVSGLRFNDSMESSNILGWLEAIVKWVLELFYKLIPNWGVSIILVTILLKICLFPLTKKSSMSTLKMQEVQPRMQELQAKYKGQPDKLNAEMAKLYQETGYNPLSGCLPLLLQFPLLWVMYNLFNNYFEFRGAMFIPGWIPDLSVGDKVLTFGFSIPFLGNELHILPIIYVFSQIIFTKITQAATPTSNENNSMKIMMYVMPLMFFFIFYNAPSGLILYWTLSNFLQLIQQMVINRMMKAKKAEFSVVKAPAKTSAKSTPKKKK